MRGLLRIVALSAVPSCCFSQPGIGQNGVVNTASRIPPTLPGGALSRGALFTISGVRFGGQKGQKRPVVLLTQKGVSTPLRVIKAGSKDLDALVPASAPIGPGELTVSVDGVASRRFPVEIVEFNPGIFSANGEGWGQGRISNLDPGGSRMANSVIHPAHRGQTISLLVTGMGIAK